MREEVRYLVAEAEREYSVEGTPELLSYEVDKTVVRGHVIVTCAGRTIGVLELMPTAQMYRVAWPDNPRMKGHGWPHERPEAVYAYLFGYWERAIEQQAAIPVAPKFGGAGKEAQDPTPNTELLEMPFLVSGWDDDDESGAVDITG
tara:strand:- start:609 stop:1046 length:438 start_codon:yes stop_codon:yes gene_type:complete